MKLLTVIVLVVAAIALCNGQRRPGCRGDGFGCGYSPEGGGGGGGGIVEPIPIKGIGK